MTTPACSGSTGPSEEYSQTYIPSAATSSLLSLAPGEQDPARKGGMVEAMDTGLAWPWGLLGTHKWPSPWSCTDTPLQADWGPSPLFQEGISFPWLRDLFPLPPVQSSQLV